MNFFKENTSTHNSQFSTNVEALTEEINDSLDRKVYTNDLAEIAILIIAKTTNTVLNIINVDKTTGKMYQSYNLN